MDICYTHFELFNMCSMALLSYDNTKYTIYIIEKEG